MSQDPYKYFRVEARELLEVLGKRVLDLERGAPAHDPVAELLRAAHTLKGAARVVKQSEIADQAHAVEEALTPFRGSTESVPGERVGAVLKLLEDIGGRLQAIAPLAEAGAVAQSVAQSDKPLRTVRADIAEMDALLEGIAAVHGHLDSARSGLNDLESARHLVDLAFEHLASRRGRIGEEMRGRNGEGDFADKARSIVQELRGSLATVGRSFAYDVEQMERELRQVRDAAEQLRLVPASSMFTALERAARDVAQALGKQVTFEGRGGHVRIDAHVLGGCEAALHQLVRNAVSHGIEAPAARKAAGKSPQGHVVLEVARRGTRVVLTCRDDGGGVDVEAVRRAAQRKGLSPDEARNLGSEDLVRLLLRGGISTAHTITEVSGRGIGLDVVRDAAERMGGEVVVRTEARRGTTIELAVPLVLASLDVLAVESAGGTTAIPLDAVRRTLRVAPSDVARSPSGETLMHDGRAIPFQSLARALRVHSSQASGTRTESAVIVEGARGLAAFGVDRLLGVSNVILRPLPELAPTTSIVAGASIDARGSPQLVLDADGLVADAQIAGAPEREASVTRARILIIDDSLTTRMLEQSILESAGYSVDLATSAEEGLSKARNERYGLFLVDVEMPGIDGFTFVEQTRADPVLRAVPAILVTSRNAPEDRERGRTAGASAYIVKGEFDQRELLTRIRELTGA